MANGPPDLSEADEIFAKSRSVTVIPDILANAGGVAVSYFEWYQNIHHESWDKSNVFEKLKSKMFKATDAVLQTQREYHTTMRDAAYITALKKFEEKKK